MRFADWIAAIALVYLAAVAWPLARTDFREHRLPNKYVVPSFGVTLAAQLVAVLAGAPFEQLLTAFGSAIVAFIAGLLANRWAGLGMGDVKLIAAITWALAWFGVIAVLAALVAGFMLASLITLARVALRKAKFHQAIPLGPYLLSGFLLASAACCTAS